MTSKRPAIAITGCSVISCAGASHQELWNNCIQNKSKIENGLGRLPANQDLAYQIAIESASVAMKQAAWDNLSPDDGFILATTTGQILRWDQSLISYLQKNTETADFARAFATQHLGVLPQRLMDKLGHTSRQNLVTSACTASSQAIIMACLWLQERRVRRVLVGGVEVLCDLTVEGFKSLQLLSSNLAAPFDQARSGINLSEGCAFLCLELADPDSDQEPLAEISGFGMSTDAYHMTSPHPEGNGVRRAILQALGSAQILASQIDWIHTHGTGSVLNDLSEGTAIHNVFGQQGAFVTSTKAIHGHALGASGILESCICIAALENQEIFRTPNLSQPDPKILVRHPDARQPQKLKHVLKTTLGFGGANSALIFSRPEAFL